MYIIAKTMHYVCICVPLQTNMLRNFENIGDALAPGKAVYCYTVINH